jgi:hypothetical protein
MASPKFKTAPVKPFKQTQILLDKISQTTEEDKPKWDQVMSLTQQELKAELKSTNAKVAQCSKDQQVIAQ